MNILCRIVRLRPVGAIHAPAGRSGARYLVRGSETGIFGPGFAGATTAGVTLPVPERDLERAKSIIDAANAGEHEARRT